MAVPGSSRVYFGSTVAYNTSRSAPLLCGDRQLHETLMRLTGSEEDVLGSSVDADENLSDEATQYIRKKIASTRETAIAYCKHTNTDFVIVEGGATGPTFNPKDLTTGFAVLAVAGRQTDHSEPELLAQTIVYSDTADREANMRLYADSAAELCSEVLSRKPSDASTRHVSVDNTVTAENYQDCFDRSSHLRSDESVMNEMQNDANAKHVVLRGTDQVLFASKDQLLLPTYADLNEDRALLNDIQGAVLKRIFVGRLGSSQTPIFALALPEDTEVQSHEAHFANTRSHGAFLNPIHNELAMTATALVNWQKSNKYCPVTGTPLEYIHGGTCARSTNTEDRPVLHWPRQDPSIIVLVENQASTHALLARSPRHPSYLYTCIAGFVEAGETFESAVLRETNEEVGVTVDDDSIQYIYSQPWPFPRSCMIGMHARAREIGLPSINIDPNELVDAQWFDKEVIYQATVETDRLGAVMDPKVVEDQKTKGLWDGKLLVPAKGVLARTLIDKWLN
mmetsp:Transcript_24907/g.56829  ORF Transcript_24907/g.56829 Transcript_24907/m.56829 type:complete len:509 (+) Transcript_24907:194-1720(+)